MSQAHTHVYSAKTPLEEPPVMEVAFGVARVRGHSLSQRGMPGSPAVLQPQLKSTPECLQQRWGLLGKPSLSRCLWAWPSPQTRPHAWPST